MSLPYFPFYPKDYEAKTAHLTLAEDGAYVRLLRLCWMTPGCSLPDDDEWIRRHMRVSEAEFVAVVRVVLDEFFVRENGRVTNPSIARHYYSNATAHAKRVEAGRKGGKAKAAKQNENTSSNATAMLKQPEPEPDIKKRDTNVSQKVRREDFDAFWAAYPQKVEKKGAEKKFAAAVKSGVEPQRIIDGAVAYSGSEKVRNGYVKNPTTWLNNGCWDDETAKPNGESGQADDMIAGWINGDKFIPQSAVNSDRLSRLIAAGKVTPERARERGLI